MSPSLPRAGSDLPAERPARRSPTAQSVLLLLQALLVVAAIGLFTLHYLHLAADFPNHSPWMDWAKYTDEGWYGDGAIRHFVRGHWYVPGDFNPAAALPVWPLLEAAIFRVTGVSLAAARALSVNVFGVSLMCVFRLLQGALANLEPPARDRAKLVPPTAPRPKRLAPAAAVVLLAASPFCYAFTRMAILEPLLILLTLLALVAAAALRPRSPRWTERTWPALAIGLLLPAMVLTKTTGLFLFPSIAWMLWARCGYRLRVLLRPAAIAAATGVSLWLLYFVWAVRPHYLIDYLYLFSANAYTGITLTTAADVLQTTLRDGRWIGWPLYPIALACGAAVLLFRRLRHTPLAVSLVLWSAGYLAFLAYHSNLQPRYYLVVAVPLTMLVPLVLESMWRGTSDSAAHGAIAAVALILAVAAGRDALRTVRYVRHPQYTFLAAAQGIARVIRSDPSHRKLLLSISGSDVTLMTGVPSICDDFGTVELEDRLKTYKPGWYAAWNQVEDDKMDALTPQFRLQRVAAFPAYDDPDRNLLILYRLDSATDHRPGRRRLRRPLPRRLVTRVGQQPSATQLQH